ncbi:MAG TPA: helix-turn-helix transcriptional regulator, partial [Thermomicrobiaceae bacterium]|nr:helix-turn-helix transcriptional regulator [Thermomicrobiaceae bacterium]
MQRQSVQRQRIGPAIRRLRQERGMTLDQLAVEAGISASHLSRLERSQTLPSFTVLAKIAEVLGVNVDEFVRLERDVTLLDSELHRYLDMLDLGHPTRDEFFDLSIEARRTLVARLRQLGDALPTPRATQEAAARALAERGVPEVWKALNRLVRQSGMGGPAFMRGWMRLLETPGPRLALITERSFFMLPPEADLIQAFRAVFPDAPLDPMLVNWWETSDWVRDPSLARRWPTRVLARRSLVAEALEGGQ